MAQWVRALAAKPGNLNSTPKILMVAEETKSCKFSSSLHTHTHTRKNIHQARHTLSLEYCLF